MKKIAGLFIILSLLLIVACEAPDPTQANWNLTKQEVFLRKMVAIGNSLTMGVQSAGIVEKFQKNSYPYLIAQQMGVADQFEQPLIDEPGLGEGGRGPMKFVLPDSIAPGDPSPADPTTIALNLTLQRPYDNLGVSGADLNDVLITTGGGLFDLVLRNVPLAPGQPPAYGNMTMIDQALILNPSLILLWIGNNDVLGAALKGTDDPAYITDQNEFADQFTTLLTRLRTESSAAIVMANIPYVTDIPYVNSMDSIFVPVPALNIQDPVPVVFITVTDTVTGLTDLVPFDFDPGQDELYLPLLTAEQSVAHLLLPALSAYQEGMGVPDSAKMVDIYQLPPQQASALQAGMMAAGLIPTGVAFPDSFSLTSDETTTIKSAVDGFNGTLASLATQFQVPVVNINSKLTTLNNSGISGVSGNYVLFDPANTGFSIDGVHPNNAGYAIVANEFISVINNALQLSIPQLNVDQYKGQYLSMPKLKIAAQSYDGVKRIFSKN